MSTFLLFELLIIKKTKNIIVLLDFEFTRFSCIDKTEHMKQDTLC